MGATFGNNNGTKDDACASERVRPISKPAKIGIALCLTAVGAGLAQSFFRGQDGDASISPNAHHTDTDREETDPFLDLEVSPSVRESVLNTDPEVENTNTETLEVVPLTPDAQLAIKYGASILVQDHTGRPVPGARVRIMDAEIQKVFGNTLIEGPRREYQFYLKTNSEGVASLTFTPKEVKEFNDHWLEQSDWAATNGVNIPQLPCHFNAIIKSPDFSSGLTTDVYVGDWYEEASPKIVTLPYFEPLQIQVSDGESGLAIEGAALKILYSDPNDLETRIIRGISDHTGKIIAAGVDPEVKEIKFSLFFKGYEPYHSVVTPDTLPAHLHLTRGMEQHFMIYSSDGTPYTGSVKITLNHSLSNRYMLHEQAHDEQVYTASGGRLTVTGINQNIKWITFGVDGHLPISIIPPSAKWKELKVSERDIYLSPRHDVTLRFLDIDSGLPVDNVAIGLNVTDVPGIAGDKPVSRDIYGSAGRTDSSGRFIISLDKYVAGHSQALYLTFVTQRRSVITLFDKDKIELSRTIDRHESKKLWDRQTGISGEKVFYIRITNRDDFK